MTVSFSDQINTFRELDRGEEGGRKRRSEKECLLIFYSVRVWAVLVIDGVGSGWVGGV